MVGEPRPPGRRDIGRGRQVDHRGRPPRVLDATGARDLPNVAEPPDGTVGAQQVPEPATAVVLDVPDHLQTTRDAAVRDALHSGRTIRRGQGYSVRVTAPLALHQAALQQCSALASDGATPAGRKAYRTYADRIAAAAKTQGA